MSVWSLITRVLGALASGESLAAVFERLRTPPERSVAFTIAVIALGAKMAKADGRVTRDEVSAFREVFTIPPGEEEAAARVFNLARQDVAGFETYARQIGRMFEGEAEPLCNLIEGLFFIAMADGVLHPEEERFLARVAELVGLSPARFAMLHARFAPGQGHDPYFVLGVSPQESNDHIRAIWRAEVRASHPDTMAARGVPPEAVRLAERRLVAINAAWDEIRAMRGLA